MNGTFKVGFILLILPLICSIGGCRGEEAPKAGGPGGGGGPAVKVLTLKPADLVLRREYTGFVEGRQEVRVRAQVDGLLLKKNYQEGAWVEKGQVLFQIDDSRYRAAVDQAEARLKGAESRRDYAEKDLERARSLMERKTIAQRDLNSAETEYANAAAAVEEAGAALKEAAVRWEMTSVRAPVSGYAGMAQQMEGALISSASPEGGLLTNIYDTSSVKVVFSVPEAQVRSIRRLLTAYGLTLNPNLEATLLIDADEVYPHPGRMEYGNASVDRASGTMLARAVFPNPDRELFNGQIVRIRLDLLHIPGRLALPQTAVMQSREGRAVAVVEADGLVSFQPVETDGPVDSFFIVKPGGPVGEGTRVIVEGLNKVRPGLKVQALEAEPDKSGSAS